LDSGDYTAGGFDCQWAGKLEFVLTCGLALVVLPRRGLIMGAIEWLAGGPFLLVKVWPIGHRWLPARGRKNSLGAL